MNEKLKEVERIVGTDLLTRTLEALKILGGKIPENFDIKYDSCIAEARSPETSNNNLHYGEIRLLTDDSNDTNINILAFYDNHAEIALFKNGYFYNWSISGGSSIDEKLYVNHGNLIVDFFRGQTVTDASSISLRDIWQESQSYIASSIADVRINNSKTTLPVDQYFNVFVDYIKTNKNKYKELANNPCLLDLIIKLYENPIKDFIDDIKNNDQSLKFEKEAANILAEYKHDLEYERCQYEKAVKRASDNLHYAFDLSTKEKDKKLDKLENLRKRYEKNQKSKK